MITLVLKILTGEEILGQIDIKDADEITNLEYFELIDPMWIVQDEYGAMKLRDAAVLSKNNTLAIPIECVIICYEPTDNLVNYYMRANEYNKQYTKAAINNQISAATHEFDQMLRDEGDYSSKISEMIRKINGSKLH